MSLAALSKHVEAMGVVLGVPTRQKSPLPQSTDNPGPSANESNVFEVKLVFYFISCLFLAAGNESGGEASSAKG